MKKNRRILPQLGAIVKLARVHQWVKNILLFLPALLGHRIFEPLVLAGNCIAFLSFSLIASSVYIFNDWVDLEFDRQHASKRNRPLASGAVSTKLGFLILSFLFFAGIGLATLLPATFQIIVGCYATANILYSFYLKKIPIVDVFFLAMLYCLRIFAGSKATDIPISPWLISFSVFFFLSLAILKRYIEFQQKKKSAQQSTLGRGYIVQDTDQLLIYGISSGYVSTLVLLLYLTSKEVSVLYSRQDLLWVISPLMLFWITRAWFLAQRDKMPDDPIVFALTDRATHFIIVAILAVTYYSI